MISDIETYSLKLTEYYYGNKDILWEKISQKCCYTLYWETPNRGQKRCYTRMILVAQWTVDLQS